LSQNHVTDAVGTELICDFSLSVAPLFCHQLSVCLGYTLLPNDESTRQQLRPGLDAIFFAKWAP
jgi:hypothetical protein